jgi:uncharacterized protein YegL
VSAPAAFIAIVLDRSGSMSPFRDDVIGGFNTLLEEQKALPGKAQLLLAQFDGQYEIVYDAVPLADVPPLTRSTFVPRAGTALLDALGRTIDDVAERLRQLPEAERPHRVLVVVFTDGEENASRQYTPTVVKERIEACRECGWEFLFLGSVVAAVDDSIGWGIDPSSTLVFSATAHGFRQAFEALSESLVLQRQGRRSVLDGDNNKKKMN